MEPGTGCQVACHNGLVVVISLDLCHCVFGRPAGVTYRVIFTSEGLRQFQRDNVLRIVGTEGWARFFGSLKLGPTQSQDGHILMTVTQF